MLLTAIGEGDKEGIYMVTITIGRCLGAVTSAGPLRIFQCDQSEGNESSGEDFYSSEGIFWIRQTLKWIVQQK